MSDLTNDPPRGPVISADLYRYETLKLESEVKDSLTRPLSRMVDDASDAIAAMLRNAYWDGLRDGFAQGVAAAHYGDNVRSVSP